MEKVLIFSLLCVVVMATRFPEESFEGIYEPFLKQVPCTSDHAKERTDLIQASKCGEYPRKVLVGLIPSASYESVHPAAAWVKRCVGMCIHEGNKKDMGCYAQETIIRNIPVKIYNVNTKKEMCSLYAVEEHQACACRAGPRAASLTARPVKLIKET